VKMAKSLEQRLEELDARRDALKRQMCERDKRTQREERSVEAAHGASIAIDMWGLRDILCVFTACRDKGHFVCV